MAIDLLAALAATLLAADLAPATSVQWPDPVAQVTVAAQAERVLLPLDPQRRDPDPHWLQVDWPRETWRAWVPPACVQGGCGLLVWIDPGDDPQLGRRGLAMLERQRIVFIAAQDAGNTASVERRRVPLAVQAAVAGCAHWRCDAQRVYVGGFSGGARAAGVAAMAWPDLFSGAVMVGGGEAPGAGAAPLPSADLLRLAQRRSRFVFVIGDGDSANSGSTRDASTRLKRACLNTQTTFTLRRSGHRHLKAAEMARALRWLDQARPDPETAAPCMQALLDQRDHELTAARTVPDRAQLIVLLRRWGNLIEAGAPGTRDKAAAPSP